MSSLLSMFGPNTTNDNNDSSVTENSELGENVLDNSMIEKGTAWVKKHPVFIMFAVIAVSGLVYLAVFRNTDPEADENSVDTILLGDDTDELMKNLDVNLTKKTKDAHLTLSDDDDDDDDDNDDNNDDDDEKESNTTGDIGIETLSNDLTKLDNLEEYDTNSSNDL